MALAADTATATAAFVATNVDDVVILAVLFARRDAGLRTRHIVAGQYLGFAVLVAVSVAAGAGLLALPRVAVAALGLIPLGMGVRGLLRARAAAGDDGDEPPAAVGTLGVASITVANGADNVAVYAPLFATVGASGFAVTSAVFGVLVGVLCAAGLLVGTRPAVVRAVDRAGVYAVPVVLVALGLYIVVAGLADAGG